MPLQEGAEQDGERDDRFQEPRCGHALSDHDPRVEERGDAAPAEPTDKATVSGRRPDRTRFTATDAMCTKLRLDTAYSHTRWSQWRVPPAPGRPDNEEDDEGEQRPFRLTELVDAGADGALGVAEGQTGDKRGDEAVAPTSSAPAKATAAREKTDSRCVYPRPTPSRPARARAVDVLGQGQPMNLVQFKRHDGGGSSSRPRRDGRAGHRR